MRLDLLRFFGFGKRYFFTRVIGFTILVCFISALGAESKEIFLPFPETWKETSETSDPGSESKENPTLSPKSKEAELSSVSPSQGNPNLTSNPTLVESQNPKDGDKVTIGIPKSDSLSSGSKSDSKKKKKKEVIDPSKASFQKGKAYLSRDQKKSAEQEFADSYSKEGEAAKFSRVENTNLYGLDGKEKESSSLVEKQEDPDLKIKSQFELARSLDRIGNPESEEKAYREYLKLVTEFPKHPELTPRSHYAMAILLIRKKEYRSAAHQLVNVIKNFKEAEEFLPSHYYLGKIYESSWEERDLERSLKYYQLYLNGVEGKNPKPGLDFRKETKERLRVLGSAI